MGERSTVTDIIGALIGYIFGFALIFGFLFLMAWGLSAGIVFVTGYELGLWRTFVALILIAIILRFIYAQLRGGWGNGK